MVPLPVFGEPAQFLDTEFVLGAGQHRSGRVVCTRLDAWSAHPNTRSRCLSLAQLVIASFFASSLTGARLEI